MGHEHNRLRIKEYDAPDGRRICVNRTYRFGVGYRAYIKGEAGKFGDSQVSPEEAIGKLFTTWIFNKHKSAEEVLGVVLLKTALEEVKWHTNSKKHLTAVDAPTAVSTSPSPSQKQQPRRK